MEFLKVYFNGFEIEEVVVISAYLYMVRIGKLGEQPISATFTLGFEGGKVNVLSIDGEEIIDPETKMNADDFMFQEHESFFGRRGVIQA